MAEYENREAAYNNGLARVVGSYAMGLVEADNLSKDAYIERIERLLNQEQPNIDFMARTTLVGLEQAMETRVSVPKVIVAPPKPIVIDETNLSLDMTVAAHSEDSLALNFGLEAEGEANIGVGMFSAKVRVKASLSLAKESKRSSDYTSTTHVDLRMVQGEAPEGLMKIIDSLNATTVKALELNSDLITQQYGRLVAESGAADAEDAG